MPQISEIPSTPAWWVHIEREFNADVLVGPYPTRDHAEIAVQESVLIDGICEEDCLDGSVIFEHAERVTGAEVILIDTDNEDHTGKVPHLTMPDAPTVTLTLRLDNAQQDALRSLLADAHQARLDAAEEMEERRGHGHGAYDRQDGIALHERSERDWALTEVILAAVDAEVAAERVALLPLDAPTPGAREHEHDWVLTEDGYSRSWTTDTDVAAGTIVATYNGSDDFSEHGTGEFLECAECRTRRALPEEWEVDYL